MLCDKCGKTVTTGDTFCGGCGDRVVATTLCDKCGKTVNAGDAFCGGCGNRATAATQPIAASTPEAMVLAPGRIFLLVTGIMYIIVGAIWIIVGLIDLFELVEDIVVVVYLLVVGGYWFVIGALGVLHRNSYGKAGLLMTLGIIALTKELLESIFILDDFFIAVLFLSIAICYIIGAYKNKNMNKA